MSLVVDSYMGTNTFPIVVWEKTAEVAQQAEHSLAKAEVEGSNPFSRSFSLDD